MRRRVAAAFEGEHDFTQFANLDPGAARTPVRRLARCDLLEGPGAELRVRIVGDGFLWKMVRHMVGALLAVGRGLMQPSRVEELLAIGSSVPAGASISSNFLEFFSGCGFWGF